MLGEPATVPCKGHIIPWVANPILWGQALSDNLDVFDKLDLERYSRQIPVLGTSGQLSLASKTVAIVGLGGLGSFIALELAGAGVGRLILIDGERVELSNLNRQILYGEQDLGLPKPVLAARRVKEFNRLVDVSYHDEFISEDNVSRLLDNADIIVDALDDWRARIIIDKYSHDTGVPLVHGAVDGWYGQATTVIPGRSPCLACIAPPEPGRRGCRAALAPVVSIIASIEALEVVKLATGRGAPLTGRLLVYDGLHGRLDEVPLKPVDCSECYSRLRDNYKLSL